LNQLIPLLAPFYIHIYFLLNFSKEKTSKSIWFVNLDKKEEKERPDYAVKEDNDCDSNFETDEEKSAESNQEKTSKIGLANPTFENDKQERVVPQSSSNSYKAAISDNLEF